MTDLDRRDFLKWGGRCLGATALIGVWGYLTHKSGKVRTYMIDPAKCTACGNCESSCFFDKSVVKARNDFKGEIVEDMCGYCTVCYGYYHDPIEIDGEIVYKKVCPVDALKRQKILEPRTIKTEDDDGNVIDKVITEERYEYTVDRKACIGCGKCVKRCAELGNKTLHLVIYKDTCRECPECLIKIRCPSGAIVAEDKLS